MAARLSEAAQTQYENLEYCNGRLCAVAAVGRAGVKADTHESAGAAPAGTPIGSGARRRCRQRHVEGGQAKPTSRCVSRPLFRDHPRPRSASALPARNPTRQTYKSFRRTCGSSAHVLAATIRRITETLNSRLKVRAFLGIQFSSQKTVPIFHVSLSGPLHLI